MPENWTGNLVGMMHCHKVSAKMLAAKLGVTDRYVSMVLNGHREPADAEERFKAALAEIIEEVSAAQECGAS